MTEQPTHKPTHDEISRRGGLSKSPAKMTAVLRNLAKAKSALSAKRALKNKGCSAAPAS
jgi:hypothetical protein